MWALCGYTPGACVNRTTHIATLASIYSICKFYIMYTVYIVYLPYIPVYIQYSICKLYNVYSLYCIPTVYRTKLYREETAREDNGQIK